MTRCTVMNCPSRFRTTAYGQTLECDDVNTPTNCALFRMSRKYKREMYDFRNSEDYLPEYSDGKKLRNVVIYDETLVFDSRQEAAEAVGGNHGYLCKMLRKGRGKCCISGHVFRLDVLFDEEDVVEDG